mgnify:CR=1 FL=1
MGIPKAKIFIINPHGEIECASKSLRRTYVLTHFHECPLLINDNLFKSYTKINELVEQMFPPYHPEEKRHVDTEEQWNDWQYWRTPPPYTLEELESQLFSKK